MLEDIYNSKIRLYFLFLVNFQVLYNHLIVIDCNIYFFFPFCLSVIPGAGLQGHELLINGFIQIRGQSEDEASN